jgi:hypothetical protein
MINKRHTVSGLKSGHGLRRTGENGLLAWHGGLLHTGETGPTRPGGWPAVWVPHAGRGHRAARVPGAARWRIGRGARWWTGHDKVLGSSTTAKRRLHRAIGLKAGLTEEVGRQWGGGERPARWRSIGGRLWWGGGGLRGSWAMRGGARGGGPGSHRRGTSWAGRAGGARVRIVAGGAGSLMSGTRLVVGGCRGERCGARVG